MIRPQIKKLIEKSMSFLRYGRTNSYHSNLSAHFNMIMFILFTGVRI
jgi:hypothetical protein